MVFAIGPQSYNTQQTSAVADRTSGATEFSPVIALLPRQAGSNLLNQLAGQTTAARILSLGPGNTAQIEVRGNPLEVKLKNLPTGQTAGDTLLINFRFEDDAQDARSVAVAGQSLVRGAVDKSEVSKALSSSIGSDLAQTDSPSSAEQLSSAGRLLGNLARIDAQLDGPFVIEAGDPGATLDRELNAENRTSGAAAGAAQAQASDKAIAQFAATAMREMAKSIENSGLFYESHLQEWSEGNRSTESLESEPQAKWSEEDSISEDRPVDPGKPKESNKLVASQLGHLDRPMINLAMPGFFGDRVELTIEPEQNQRREPKAKPVWYATVKMQLSHLGQIDLRLTMTSDQCNLHVKASPETRDAITGALPELDASMAAAGLRLTAQAMNREASDGTE